MESLIADGRLPAEAQAFGMSASDAPAGRGNPNTQAEPPHETHREWTNAGLRGRNLAELWRQETADLEIAEPRGFAISLNGAVVRRAAWPSTAVRDGDAVEIIRAMAGGTGKPG